MNKIKKVIIAICLILGISSIFIGTFAYYRIVKTGKIIGNTGSVVFTLKDINNNNLNNQTISLNNGEKVVPGDNGSFTITMDSSGSSVDMYATLEIDRGNLPTNLKFYITSDNKTELKKYYSFFEKDKTTSETLTIYWYWNPYIDDIEDSKYINKDTLNATIKVSAHQVSAYAVMKNGYSTTNGGTEFWNDNYRPNIKTITFDNNINDLPLNCTESNLCWDLSESNTQSKKVYGYLTDSGEKDTNSNTLYDLHIVSKAPIFAPSNANKMFYQFTSLTTINFNNNFNTSNVTNMGSMFSGCISLTTLDLSGFNTKNVQTMGSMFSSDKNLTEIDLTSLNTKNVTSIASMFSGCSSLTSLDLTNFNTEKVNNTSYTFSGCSKLQTIDISSFNTINVTNMNYMFSGCTSLKKLDLKKFNTSNVTTMSTMFNYCKTLETLDLSNFNTSNVTNMNSIFKNCMSLKTLNINNFNISKVTDLAEAFYNCSTLTTIINITNPNITNYNNIFYGSATNDNAKITINYTSNTSTIVDNIIATKSSGSKITKNQI